MSEPPTPTHVLLQQMKSTDDTACEQAFEVLMYRFLGPFERYGREKLGPDDAHSATNDTFVKIYKSRKAYKEAECACKQDYTCIELCAHKYLWIIHKRTVIDWLRQRQRKKSLPMEEMPDKTCPAPESSDISPEAYVEARIKQEIILRAWNSLSEADRQLINYEQGRGRPSPRLQQARSEALRRFRIALEAARAEEE